MINILVPTDFTAGSLKLAESAIKSLNEEKVNIILFHAFELTYYYQDLLTGDTRPYLELMNDDLRQACKKLKEQFPRQVDKVLLKFMQGSSVALFKNFVEINKIDFVVCPPGYVFEKIHSRSVNPINLFKKSRIKVLPMFTNEKSQSLQQNSLRTSMAYSLSNVSE